MALGFRHDPWLAPRQPTRQVIEVFPHPATITLFGLPQTLKYKARPGRDYPSRRAELARLHRLLLGLRVADPPLFLSPDLERLAFDRLAG